MTDDREALKEEINAELLAEMTAKKKHDYAWRTANIRLRDKVIKELQLDGAYGYTGTYQVATAISVLGKAALSKKRATQFTEADVDIIEAMLDEMLLVLKRYQDERA